MQLSYLFRFTTNSFAENHVKNIKEDRNKEKSSVSWSQTFVSIPFHCTLTITVFQVLYQFKVQDA